jgi:hypothetical protein
VVCPVALTVTGLRSAERHLSDANSMSLADLQMRPFSRMVTVANVPRRARRATLPRRHATGTFRSGSHAAQESWEGWSTMAANAHER